MLTVKGIYEQGRVKLSQDVNIDKVMNVLITFLEEPEAEVNTSAKQHKFSFAKSKELLKNYKGCLSDAVLDERRSHV